MDWPPNYAAELQRRFNLERTLTADPELRAAALARYAECVTTFASDCCWLVEPRNANLGEPTTIPLVLFDRQAEFLTWLNECFEKRISAPVEKSRDSGATWMACVFAVWLWLFKPGSTIGFGSRKEMLVDRQGDMQSIFPKIRSLIRRLPHYVVPKGFDERAHSNYMRILNPALDTSIVGEAGDQIGRGGRTSIYFVDEAAYLEHPQEIEASLTATTDCRIDISSPRVGTLFHEWCASSPHKFIFDVHDAPWHTKEWADSKRAELEAKGMGLVFKREYLRDATAGLAGQLISSEWIEAAIGAAERMKLTPSGKRIAGLDVADGGQDANALAVRHGPRLIFLQRRNDLRADEAGAWAYAIGCDNQVEELRYEALGVGAGAAATLRIANRPREGERRGAIKEIVAWSPSDRVLYPRQPWDCADGRSNQDMFLNANSQAWWHLRTRFYETFKASIGVEHDPEMVISLDADLADLRQLKSELSQVLYKLNANGKVVVDKAPEGFRSPNLADALKIAFAPTPAGFEILGIF